MNQARRQTALVARSPDQPARPSVQAFATAHKIFLRQKIDGGKNCGQLDRISQHSLETVAQFFYRHHGHHGIQPGTGHPRTDQDNRNCPQKRRIGRSAGAAGRQSGQLYFNSFWESGIKHVGSKGLPRFSAISTRWTKPPARFLMPRNVLVNWSRRRARFTALSARSRKSWASEKALKAAMCLLGVELSHP